MARVDAEMREQPRREARHATAAVGVTHDGAQRETANPVAAAFVAEHVAPAAGPRRFALVVAPVRNRSRSRHDDDAGRVADAGLQRDERVVDDENARLVADAAHDAAHDRFVGRAIDARDAEADGRRNDAGALERLFHDRMKDLLERELSGALQVRAFFARLQR